MDKGLTISDFKSMKSQAEADILRILRNLQDLSYCYVKSIDLSHVTLYGRRCPEVQDVTIDVLIV